MHDQWIVVDEHLVQRIRSEYLEMPGLRLTRSQVRRLLGTDETMAAAIVRALVDRKFLVRTHDGAYARANHEQALARRPQMIKAAFPRRPTRTRTA